jgi:hypothetical protein
MPDDERQRVIDGIPDTLSELDDVALAELESAASTSQWSHIATEQFMREMNREFGLLDVEDAPEGALAFERGGRTVYPGFQFVDGSVKPVIRELAQVAATFDRSPKAVFVWLCSSTTYVRGGGRPVDLIDSEPGEVIRIAKEAWGVVW